MVDHGREMGLVTILCRKVEALDLQLPQKLSQFTIFMRVTCGAQSLLLFKQSIKSYTYVS